MNKKRESKLWCVILYREGEKSSSGEDDDDDDDKIKWIGLTYFTYI